MLTCLVLSLVKVRPLCPILRGRALATAADINKFFYQKKAIERYLKNVETG
jgi:hypothetical protein